MKIDKLSNFFATLAVLVSAVLSDRTPTPKFIHLSTSSYNSQHTVPSPVHTISRKGRCSRLSKRANEVWDEAVCRGKKLLKAMNSPDTEAGVDYEPKQPTGQSPFHDIQNDLLKWGYTHDKGGPTSTTNEKAEDWYLQEALLALGLNHGGNIATHDIWHQDPRLLDQDGERVPPNKQTYIADGRTYRSTGARNTIYVDHKGGAIYALFMQSPRSSCKRTWRIPIGQQCDPNELPALRQFSDIMWGAWTADVIAERLKNVKYYFSVDIQNMDCETVITKALSDVGASDEPWPGWSFDMGTDAGAALLGTPNGRVIAYMLSQRKEQLGHKTVTKVNAFINSDPAESYRHKVLVFHVADVASST